MTTESPILTPPASALRREAGAALPARRDCADEHTVANRVAAHSSTYFVNDAYRLMPDNQSGLYWILAAQDMQVRPADRCQRDLDYNFANSRTRFGHLLDTNVIDAEKDIRLHGFHK